MADDLKQLKDEEQERRNGRSERRAARRSGGFGSNMTGGLILIGIGVVFLLSNWTEFRLDNWWALFILIPVVAAWGNAYRAYQAAGGWSQEARNSIVGSLFPLFIAVIFLFNLDWGRIWPGFLILAGIAALVGRGD